MKTLKGWQKSNVDLGEYLGNAPCRINEELNKYGMRLVSNAIFKGRPPYSEYMGSKTDWEQIIQNEVKNNKNRTKWS